MSYTKKIKVSGLLVFFIVALFSSNNTTFASSGDTSRLTISVIGMTSDKGRIQSFLCKKNEAFPQRCKLFSVVPAANGVVDVVYSSVEPGTYAFTTFHDENSDFKLGYSKMGYPNEGVGFSGDSSKLTGAPDFDKSAFEVKGDTKIIVKLVYLSEDRPF